jgi:hypothetical protein
MEDSHISTSTTLQNLADDVPSDHFTLHWLVEGLNKRAFGIVVFLLALIAMVPGISFLAGFLLIIPALEMIAGRTGPSFPASLSTRPLPTRHLTSAVRRASLVLKYFERAIRPRWHTPPEPTKRIVGFAILLMAFMLLIPVPMIQVIPASIIVMISLAYIEDDGLLLAVAFALGIAVLAITSVAIWQIIF